ncbi:hypothetical protein, partial [Viridibacterium curvum]|uniref:hypothetical protein n=1 Tax=Viridibacterium curvum TaxID=1101404 RepID=UPI0031E75698
NLFFDLLRSELRKNNQATSLHHSSAAEAAERRDYGQDIRSGQHLLRKNFETSLHIFSGRQITSTEAQAHKGKPSSYPP